MRYTNPRLLYLLSIVSWRVKLGMASFQRAHVAVAASGAAPLSSRRALACDGPALPIPDLSCLLATSLVSFGWIVCTARVLCIVTQEEPRPHNSRVIKYEYKRTSYWVFINAMCIATVFLPPQPMLQRKHIQALCSCLVRPGFCPVSSVFLSFYKNTERIRWNSREVVTTTRSNRCFVSSPWEIPPP